MAIDRYSGDYRIQESVDEKGRIHSSAEYIGALYVLAAGEKRAARAGRKAAVCCVGAWLGFFAALLLESAAMRSLYVALPCAFAALPLWFMSSAVLTALRVKKGFTHRDADRLNLRFPASCVFTAVLSAAALIGGLCSLFIARNAALPGDWLFLGGNLLCLVCAVLAKRQGRDLEARPQ